jgi:hypothetical protein
MPIAFQYHNGHNGMRYVMIHSLQAEKLSSQKAASATIGHVPEESPLVMSFNGQIEWFSFCPLEVNAFSKVSTALIRNLPCNYSFINIST